MQLKITQGQGSVVAATLTSDGKSETLVNDPNNTHRPAVPLAEWVQDSGGTKPIEGEKPDAPEMGVGRISGA